MEREHVIVYFDNAATTSVRPDIIETITDCMSTNYGNPASSHAHGRRAAILLERARNNVAHALGTKPKCIYFTSGGTEANNLAIFGVSANRTLTKNGRHIITSLTEHDSVLKPIKKLEKNGFDITYLPPDNTGRIPLETFAGALRDDTVFASVMLVNNETGAVNPVSGYAKEISNRGLSTVLHTDAVQGFCKIPFAAHSVGADLISVSAHKLHGPKGAGALCVSERIKLSPVILGGSQEGGMRAGTEALPAVVGFGEAVRLSYSEQSGTLTKVTNLYKHLADSLMSEIPGCRIIGEGDSPFILCFSVPGFKSEVLLNYLDSENICVSKGAACKKGMRNPTLEAMNLPGEVIDGALRLSFSKENTMTEADYFVSTLKKAVQTLLH